MNISALSDGCYMVLGIIFFIRELIKIAFILIPIGLIVMISIDFAKGVMFTDDDKIPKIVLKRIIYTIIVFLIPTLIYSLFSIFSLSYQDSKTCWAYATSSNINSVKKIVKEEEEKLNKQATSSQETINSLTKTKVQAQAKKASIKTTVKNKSTSSTTSTDNKVYNGNTYKLSQKDKQFLAGVCKHENGSNLKSMQTEASLIANLYELSNSNKSIANYIRNSKWFSSKSKKSTTDSTALEAVESVLVQGNRVIPLYINEHDCWFCNSKKCSNGNKGDICTVDGNKEKSYITNRNNYKKDKTIIKNKYTSTYTFYFFPSEKSDPFGYTENAKKKIDKLNK